MSVTFAGGSNVGPVVNLPTSAQWTEPWQLVDLSVLAERSLWSELATLVLVGFSIYGVLKKASVATSVSFVVLLTGLLLLILGLDASGGLNDTAGSPLLCRPNMTNSVQGAISLDFAGLTVRKGSGAGAKVIVNNVTGR